MFYFLAGCIVLSLGIIGATYAYFTASISNSDIVKGESNTTSFALAVRKVTKVDMAFGLVPMKNSQAPNAARQGCYDDFGNAGCQMYEITVKNDSSSVMFLDGYIVVEPKEGVEIRFASVSKGADDQFYTKFTNEEFKDAGFVEELYIKDGVRVSDAASPFDRVEDFGCLLVEDQQIGGEAGDTLVFYAMIWVYDNGQSQDYLQGMELAYRGEVTFVTAQGNEITATFD